MEIKKENLCFLSGKIRRKESYKDIQVSFMPFDYSELPEGEQKWNFLKDKAVSWLIEEKELPSFALKQDYDHNGLTYTSFITLEKIAYSNHKEDSIKEIKVFNNAFDKIILPEGYREKIIEVVEQLKESKKIFEEWGLDEKIKRGKGVNMLFSGASGTGKTYCGEVVAEYLGTDFEVISVASFESKWVGESEKNISNIFKSIKGANKVLILDEVDSFLTSRSNLNQEYQTKLTNQILIELERHNGICIMTTNRPVKLDKALQRRIDLVLDFPEPNQEARKKIWEYMIPKKMPLDGELDFDKISSYEINGGIIKNAVLSSARKAISRNKMVSTDIIMEAILEEIEDLAKFKNGKDHS